MVNGQYFSESALPKSARAEVNISKYPSACCRDRSVSLSIKVRQRRLSASQAIVLRAGRQLLSISRIKIWA